MNKNNKVLKISYIVQAVAVIFLILLSILQINSDFDSFENDYYQDRQFLQDSDFGSMSIEEYNEFCDEFKYRFENNKDKSFIASSYNFIDYNKAVENTDDNCRESSRYNSIPSVLVEKFETEAIKLQGYEFSFYKYLFAHANPSETPYQLLLVLSIIGGVYGLVIDSKFKKFIGTLNINESNAKVYFFDRLKELKQKNAQGFVMITIMFSLLMIWITEGRMLLFPGVIFLALYMLVGFGISIYFKQAVKMDDETIITNLLKSVLKNDDGLFNVLVLQNKYSELMQTHQSIKIVWRKFAILVLLLVPMAMIALELLITLFWSAR